MPDDLQRIADRIAAVSPAWRAAIGVRQPDAGAPRALRVRQQLRLGVETIYEGYALHYTAPRLLDDQTGEALRLLIGDYCYAAGLCDVAETGDLDAVRTLADLIADVACLAAGDDPAPAAPGAPDPRELRWNEALDHLKETTE